MANDKEAWFDPIIDLIYDYLDILDEVEEVENGNDDSKICSAEGQEPTTKNDSGVDYTINSLDDFIEFGKKAFGVELTVTPQEPRWIPVNERLPEENKTVIASTEYGVYPEARYTKEDGWEWAYESGADYWEEIGCNVLAWMPLPKPYREVEE